MALLAVFGSYDVRLDRVFRRVGRIAGDDASLVERPVAQVCAPTRFAAVAAAPQDDRTLLLHGTPPSRQTAFVVGPEATRDRVASPERVLGGPVVLHHGGYIGARLRRIVLVLAGVVLGEHPVFEVRHHPGTGSGPRAPGRDGAEVEGVHGAGAVGFSIGLAVSVVEAAAAVVVLAARHQVHALGLTAERDARLRGVDPVAVAGIDVEGVDLLTAQRQ